MGVTSVCLQGKHSILWILSCKIPCLPNNMGNEIWVYGEPSGIGMFTVDNLFDKILQ